MRFAVIASSRTGSSAFTESLNRRPDILCNGEIFHPQQVKVRWSKQELTLKVHKELLELRERDPNAFLERIYATNYGRVHVGFKIFGKHNPAVLKKLVKDRGVKKIVQFRRNVLAKYSSMQLAAATGEWGRTGPTTEKTGGTKEKVLFDPQHFWAFCQEYLKFYRDILQELEETNQGYHFINYEEINNPEFFRAAVRFIGGDTTNIKLATTMVKQNSTHILSRFSNPNDVREFLKANGLLHWSHEGEVTFSPVMRETRQLAGNSAGP
jgi:hypothetical protein